MMAMYRHIVNECFVFAHIPRYKYDEFGGLVDDFALQCMNVLDTFSVAWYRINHDCSDNDCVRIHASVYNCSECILSCHVYEIVKCVNKIQSFMRILVE